MGRDIHLSIVKNGEYLAENIFIGRNQEWFSDLLGDGWDDAYDELPKNSGVSYQVPLNYEKKYNKDNFYYGFYYVHVKDFKQWYLKFRPDLDAGWVSTYDKWKYENKGILPSEVNHYLNKDDNINDMHFIEFVNEYDCSRWLYKYIYDHGIPDDADIIYCFDC